VLAGVLVPHRLEARWRHFAGSNRQFADAYRAQRGFLMPDEALAFAGPALRDPSVWREASEELDGVEQRWLAPAAAEQPSAAVARLESRWYLSSQLLRDIDVMSMAHGIEVRVPYIDHELLETVWPDLGFHAALVRRKRILHETLDRPLPENIVRQSKKGFTLPFARWIGGELAPAVQDGMRQLSESGWIGREVPDGVWRAWTSGTMHWTRPWGLAVLGHLVSSCHQHRVHV
jgi:asparagine synthetase B (glutamine-hydrolysing)